VVAECRATTGWAFPKNANKGVGGGGKGRDQQKIWKREKGAHTVSLKTAARTAERTQSGGTPEEENEPAGPDTGNWLFRGRGKM